jgi:chemotaxis protein MotA
VLVIVGYLVVLGSVFGGYALMGGHFGALFQPLELLMIAGSAIGAFIVGNDRHAISATLKTLPKLLKSSKKRDKALYMELLALLYVLLATARLMLARIKSGKSDGLARISKALRLGIKSQ